MKRCNGPCDQVKEDQKYYTKRYKNGSIGLRSMCIDCGTAARNEWRAKNKAWDDARNNEYNKRNARKIKGFKLIKYWPSSTPEQALEKFEELQRRQENKCAICKRIKRLAVDHCHDTGKVRGLLCNSCNRGLGLFQDRADVLEIAKIYITA